jgi:hypothetical protein
MRIIAFITCSADIGKILKHIRAQAGPPCITPACGLPLWGEPHSQVDVAVQPLPDGDEACQAAPD